MEYQCIYTLFNELINDLQNLNEFDNDGIKCG